MDLKQKICKQFNLDPKNPDKVWEKMGIKENKSDKSVDDLFANANEVVKNFFGDMDADLKKMGIRI